MWESKHASFGVSLFSGAKRNSLVVPPEGNIELQECMFCSECVFGGCYRAKMLVALSDFILTLACIFLLAFRGIASVTDMLIIRGILLEAGAFGKDLQEPDDWTQISRGQPRDLEVLHFSYDPCWHLNVTHLLPYSFSLPLTQKKPGF